ncbi:MAG TPA: hypothetical protein VIH29_07225, partial [Gallionella sp.]
MFSAKMWVDALRIHHAGSKRWMRCAYPPYNSTIITKHDFAYPEQFHRLSHEHTFSACRVNLFSAKM